MTYRGHIKNGVAVLEEPVGLADGTPVTIQVERQENDFWKGKSIDELARQEGRDYEPAAALLERILRRRPSPRPAAKNPTRPKSGLEFRPAVYYTCDHALPRPFPNPHAMLSPHIAAAAPAVPARSIRPRGPKGTVPLLWRPATKIGTVPVPSAGGRNCPSCLCNVPPRKYKSTYDVAVGRNSHRRIDFGRSTQLVTRS